MASKLLTKEYYCNNLINGCLFLGFTVKLFLTFISLMMLGICGYMFSILFNYTTFWIILFTLGVAIFGTLLISCLIRSSWNHMYNNYIKQYIPKKKKKMRDNRTQHQHQTEEN